MATKLQVTELDFDDIKNNLKTYMKNQTEFTDYNFEGSGLSTIIDLLAYNTHYLAMNANMAVNEDCASAVHSLGRGRTSEDSSVVTTK